MSATAGDLQSGYNRVLVVILIETVVPSDFQNQHGKMGGWVYERLDDELTPMQKAAMTASKIPPFETFLPQPEQGRSPEGIYAVIYLCYCYKKQVTNTTFQEKVGRWLDNSLLG